MNASEKSNSFLHTFYQKFLKKQDKTGAAPDAATLIAETLEEIQPPAASVSPEQQFWQPIFDLYLYDLQQGFVSEVLTELSSFIPWSTLPIAGNPLASAAERDLALFEKLLAGDATRALKKISDDEKRMEAAILEQAIRGSEPAAEGTLATAQSSQPPLPLPMDAVCKVCISGDKLSAYLFAFPPRNGGKPMDIISISKALEKSSVRFGLDQDLMMRLSEEQSYYQLFQIAAGQAAVNGTDGELIPQIDCNTEIEIRENEQGIADYKNLNFLHSAVKGQVLCVIVLPQPGVPGTNVRGDPIPPKEGKAIADPCGKNTMLSEDKTRLLAGIDGQISKKGSRYHIEPTLVIDANVDYGVGNVFFDGDIVIKGDVCNGFTVKAGGNITISGSVESADIISGGDVVILKGMNGNFSGYIDAKGSVKTSFLENCTVHTEGTLHADSIVSSKVFCGDSVHVSTKHGTIIGGTITALKSVEAKVIGTQGRRQTDITLGEIPRLSEKKAQAELELNTVAQVLDKLDKNLDYLISLPAPLPPERQEIYQQLKLQQVLYTSRKEELDATLAELALTRIDFSQCRLKCGMIYPPTKITIGSEVRLLTDSLSHCLIFRGQDGIVTSSM